jgi:hypothetical protein
MPTPPSTGKDTTVDLILQPGPGVPIPAFGTAILDTAVRSFTVQAEVDVISTMHLGTTEADEDMTPRGYSGSFIASIRDGRLQAAYDVYLQAQRDGLSCHWLIVHTTRYRNSAEPPQTRVYQQVSLQISESHEAGQANSANVTFRSPRRT